MNKNLRVSVIVVTRNRVEVLLQCLHSVFAQDYDNIEVIVVDNNSADNTVEMVKAKFPAALVLCQNQNMGAIHGRNIGVAKATGELCVFVDDDAIFIDNVAFKRVAQYFLADSQICCVSMRIVDCNNIIARKFIPRRDRKEIIEDRFGAMFVTTGCMMRRSAFLEVGGFWEDLTPYFGGEPEISYRLLDKGYKILHTPYVTVKHFEVPIERDPSRRIYQGTRNTPWIALRNLPWYSVIGLTILTWGYFFLVAVKENQIPAYCRAIKESIKHWPNVYRMRRVISAGAVKTVWQCSGLILF